MHCLRLLLLTLPALTACASQSHLDRAEFVVAEETVSLDKRPFRGKSNLKPWVQKRIVELDGTELLVISNSCGFAEITYRVRSIQEFVSESETSGRELVVANSMGEWCHVRHLIIDFAKLLHLRNWRGTRYLQGSAPIIRDAEERPLIVDAGFIENAGLVGLLTLLGTDPRSGFCFSKSDLTSELIEELRAEAELVETVEGVCFKQGVYLHDLLANLATAEER